MTPLGPGTRVFAWCEAVDMRRGFEGLWALATQQMGHDVLAGDLFLFLGRDRRRCKVLFFDGTGVCLLHKRLSKGLFAALWRHADKPQLQLSRTELQLFLEGSEAVGRMPLSPAPLERTELRRFSSENDLK
ncbi:MAG TPA: IS66 family insertion sequence element accessory protein TnpB [Pseudomonadota bacterium]|nr:IS66 family insertion sequence element accessory protein TnpB [Pseudomonadota bacterium]